MDIFDLLEINPESTKVHLAQASNGYDPLMDFFNGTFIDYQKFQNKKNFERDKILSLIKLPGENLWLYAGVYSSHGIIGQEDGYHEYDTSLTKIGSSLIGRLVIEYRRAGRVSYPNCENLVGKASIAEIKSEPLGFSDFKSFKDVLLTRRDLEGLIRTAPGSWRSPLQSVSGIYLITDKANGKQYVGSAYGENGIWGRWSEYAKNYHGGNKSFVKMYNVTGPEAFSGFQYSILETTDIDADKDLVISLENKWKEKLLTREFGYNEN